MTNCLKYDARGCSECSSGFELVNSTSCVQISIPNCLKKQGGKCVACKKDFALDYKNVNDPQCNTLPSSIVMNCEQTSLNDEENEEGILDGVCK